MIIVYKCNLCANQTKKYYANNQNVAPFLQCECKGVLEKQIPDFNVASYEIVDNGAMVKKVELRKDAVEKAKAKGDAFIQTMKDRRTVIKKNED